MPNGTSKYKGVSWRGQRRKWTTQITCGYRNIYVGIYENEVDAALAYDEKARELFGEFACVNFPSHQEALNFGVQNVQVSHLYK